MMSSNAKSVLYIAIVSFCMTLSQQSVAGGGECENGPCEPAPGQNLLATCKVVSAQTTKIDQLGLPTPTSRDGIRTFRTAQALSDYFTPGKSVTLTVAEPGGDFPRTLRAKLDNGFEFTEGEDMDSDPDLYKDGFYNPRTFH